MVLSSPGVIVVECWSGHLSCLAHLLTWTLLDILVVLSLGPLFLDVFEINGDSGNGDHCAGPHRLCSSCLLRVDWHCSTLQDSVRKVTFVSLAPPCPCLLFFFGIPIQGGHSCVTDFESKIHFFLTRELNWEATKDRVNKRALQIIEKEKAKKRLEAELQNDRRRLNHRANREVKNPQDI